MSKATKWRGAPRRGEPSARERLIETAIELFYQEGIRAIGIDTVGRALRTIEVLTVSDIRLQGGINRGLCRGAE